MSHKDFSCVNIRSHGALRKPMTEIWLGTKLKMILWVPENCVCVCVFVVGVCIFLRMFVTVIV